MDWPESDDLCLHALRHAFLTRLDAGADAFWICELRLYHVRPLSEASRRTTVEEQDEARAGALRIES